MRYGVSIRRSSTLRAAASGAKGPIVRRAHTTRRRSGRAPATPTESRRRNPKCQPACRRARSATTWAASPSRARSPPPFTAGKRPGRRPSSTCRCWRSGRGPTSPASTSPCSTAVRCRRSTSACKPRATRSPAPTGARTAASFSFRCFSPLGTGLRYADSSDSRQLPWTSDSPRSSRWRPTPMKPPRCSPTRSDREPSTTARGC